MYHIFVDGSASDQAKTFNKKECRNAGIGIYHPESNTKISEKFILPNPTNNRAEFYACIRALEWVIEKTKDEKTKDEKTKDEKTKDEKTKVILYSDSQLVINSITKWIYNWKKNGWRKSNNKPILNLDLIIKLDNLINNFLPLTTFIKVKAHLKKPDNPIDYLLWEGNHIADKLAYEGRCK